MIVSRPARAARAPLYAALLLVLGVTGCAWASFFAPARADGDGGLVHEARVSAGPARQVEVLLDEHGVPHIYAAHDEDLAYGLGFMHARDRLFQVLVLKHAASGRLGEIFGKGLVEEDRRLRLLSYRLDDEEAALPPQARALAEAYVAGLNEGAAHAGRSLEMQLLGLNASPFEVRDVLAIARLQNWELSLDLRAELARARVVARLPQGDPRRKALLQDVPSADVPIVRKEVVTPPASFVPRSFEAAPLPDRVGPASPAEEPAAKASVPAAGGPPAPPRAPLESSLMELFSSLPLPGGSNAWAVHGSRTASGRPILVNDPHLAHRAPGVFYLAHLEGSDGLSVTGVTLPGIPAVVIGHSDQVAWAMTTSFADTQDLVRLKVSPEHKGRYLVEGRELPFGTHVERFLAGGDTLLSESWATTMFGPVLPPGYETEMEPGETYALLWSGFDPEATQNQLLAFWQLARARDLDEASRALGNMAASQSALLATRDGHIAYRLTGKIPVRRSSEPSSLPRDGSTTAAGWSGYLAAEEHPASTDPASGYLVAANQRITADDHRAARSVGGYAATPHRALRIDERVRALLAAGKADADSLLAIQQDIVSVEARALAGPLGAACPERISNHPQALARAFCDAVRHFDGSYSVDSKGALPFTVLLATVQEEILAAHLGPDVARQLLHQPFVVMAIERALLEDGSETPSALLDDQGTPQREGLGGFVKDAAERALTRVIEYAGADPEGWVWGKVHTLAAAGPLASAPLIGAAFAADPRAQSGWNRAPRAEAGLPVRSGAVLRFVAEMSEPVQARLVTDFGNTGHIGDERYGGLIERWERGELLSLPRARGDVEQHAEGRLLLLPRAE